MSTATAVDYRDEDFAQSVRSFSVDIDSENLNALQQDGATAIVDLAGEYEAMGCSVNTLLKARVLGRLSDIQIRDFALVHIMKKVSSRIRRCGPNFYPWRLQDLLHLWRHSVRPLHMKVRIRKAQRSIYVERLQMMRGTHLPRCYSASLHQAGPSTPLPQCALIYTPKSAP